MVYQNVDDLTGTNWSKIPVALIEMGFMTNKTEDKQMQKKQTQKKMVDGIAMVLINILNNQEEK